MLDIKLNEEQISKIKIISKEYSELRKRYHDLIKDIKKELNVPEKYPILGFLYYSVIEGRFDNRKKVEKCRLAYLNGYRFRRFDDISISEYFEFNPVFRAVSKDGKPGNCHRKDVLERRRFRAFWRHNRRGSQDSERSKEKFNL